MNAVDILCNVEKYFDRNHDLFCRWGGLFALIFFMLYVPFSMVGRMQDKLDAQQTANVLLTSELETLNHKVEFLNLSYEKKQLVLKEVECLARNIYFEAGGEPYAGKVAVAEVTMNRVRSSAYPKTVCGVVHQKAKGVCQFSWVCEGKKRVNVRTASWTESMRISQQMLVAKKDTNVVGDAKFFHAHYVEPNWSRTKTFVKKIGNHLFYQN
jgi:spore germination cell wall hydrolase CwlJ-like protein